MGEHTPGPWTFSAQNGGPGSCFVAQIWGPTGQSLAEVETTDEPGEATANAALMAAAPDLLEVAIAGARYSDALKALQDAGLGPGMVEGSDELDRLLEDWHTKAHAVLDRLKKG